MVSGIELGQFLQVATVTVLIYDTRTYDLIFQIIDPDSREVTTMDNEVSNSLLSSFDIIPDDFESVFRSSTFG